MTDIAIQLSDELRRVRKERDRALALLAKSRVLLDELLGCVLTNYDPGQSVKAAAREHIACIKIVLGEK